MYFSSVALRLALSAGAVLGASGCTRTYDGSIVPAYETRLASDGILPRLEFEEVDVAPPNRVYKFPPPPTQPALVAEVEQPRQRAAQRTTRRQQSRPAVQQRQTETPGIVPALYCRNETSEGGRVRVVCM